MDMKNSLNKKKYTQVFNQDIKIIEDLAIDKIAEKDQTIEQLQARIKNLEDLNQDRTTLINNLHTEIKNLLSKLNDSIEKNRILSNTIIDLNDELVLQAKKELNLIQDFAHKNQKFESTNLQKAQLIKNLYDQINILNQKITQLKLNNTIQEPIIKPVKVQEPIIKPQIIKIRPGGIATISNQSNIKFSVVMMSYLKDYPGARTNPIPKFHRAIRSFLNQTHANRELIIVSDGCEITNQEYLKWQHIDTIKLIHAQKSDFKWPGSQRQLGVDAATGDWIAYLDTDDIYHPLHLQNIVYHIESNKGVRAILNSSFAQLIDMKDWNNKEPFNVSVAAKTITIPANQYPLTITDEGKLYYYATRELDGTQYGTSRTFHAKEIPAKWEDSNQRGEDLIFSNKLRALPTSIRIDEPSYIVCHIPNNIDM